MWLMNELETVAKIPFKNCGFCDYGVIGLTKLHTLQQQMPHE